LSGGLPAEATYPQPA